MAFSKPFFRISVSKIPFAERALASEAMKTYYQKSSLEA